MCREVSGALLDMTELEVNKWNKTMIFCNYIKPLQKFTKVYATLYTLKGVEYLLFKKTKLQ